MRHNLRMHDDISVLVRRALRLARRKVLAGLIPPKPPSALSEPDCIRVVGLLSSVSGLGQSARLCVRSLEDSARRVDSVDVSKWLGQEEAISWKPDPTNNGVFRCSIYHLNPPMLLRGILASGIRRYRSTYAIGYWAWELDKLPHEWVEALDYVDTVLVPSEFCRRVVQSYTTKPVMRVPHPLSLSSTSAPSGLAARWRDIFKVVSVFSFKSSYARKNPVATVLAFKMAFGNDPTKRLILKVTDGQAYAADMKHLTAAIAGAPNIELVDEVWSEAQLMELIASADVYISLHRSEGFGLTIAEAIIQGVPVIVTGWSGPVDFCHPGLAYVVDYQLRSVSSDHPDLISNEGVVWAEADISQAAHFLKHTAQFPTEAKRRALELRTRFLKYLSEHTYAGALDEIHRVTVGAPNLWFGEQGGSTFARQKGTK
jgi:glycosyltransferase involved in cell wall biosynthesis